MPYWVELTLMILAKDDAGNTIDVAYVMFRLDPDDPKEAYYLVRHDQEMMHMAAVEGVIKASKFFPGLMETVKDVYEELNKDG